MSGIKLNEYEADFSTQPKVKEEEQQQPDLQDVQIDLDIPDIDIPDLNFGEDMDMSIPDINLSGMEVPDMDLTGGEESQETEVVAIDTEKLIEELRESNKNARSERVSSYIEDVDMTETFSDAFIDIETEKFIQAFKTTLCYLENRSDAIIQNEPRKIITKSDSDRYNKEIEVMEEVLGAIRKYHEDQETILPKVISDKLDKGEYLEYTSKKGIELGYQAFVDNMCRLYGDDQDRLNKMNNNRVKLMSLYRSLANMYMERESAENQNSLRTAKLRSSNAKINKMYYTILDKLESGERVTLCNHINFNRKDAIRYDFYCGKCNELVKGQKYIVDDNGSHVMEPMEAKGNHFFHSWLPVSGKSCYYPLVCEKCGAINVLSASTRQEIDTNMKKSPMEDSLDKQDYNGAKPSEHMVRQDRMWLTENKWRDVLASKIHDDIYEYEDNAHEAGWDNDKIMDSIFIIDNDIEENNNDILGEVTDDEYANAIRYFRQKEKTYDIVAELDNKIDRSKEIALAITAKTNTTTVLKSLFSKSASRIIQTASFKYLERLQNKKNEAYDKYLLACSAIDRALSGYELREDITARVSNKLGVPFKVSDLTEVKNSSYAEYKQAREEYEKFRDKLLTSKSIFGYKSASDTPNAIDYVARVFEYKGLDKFFDDIMIEVINNIRFLEPTSFMGCMGPDGKAIVQPIGNKKSVKDSAHLLKNKQDNVKEAFNRLGKIPAYKEVSSPLKKYLAEFNSDFRQYLNVTNLARAFSCSMDSKIRNNENDSRFVQEFNITLNSGDLHVMDFSDVTDETFNDLLPQFETKEYFNIFLPGVDMRDSKISKDALILFVNNYLKSDKFGVYDIFMCKALIACMGYEKAVNMNVMTIANKLETTDGIVQVYYMQNVNELSTMTNSQHVKFTDIVKLCNHLFITPACETDCADVVRQYYEFVCTGYNVNEENDISENTVQEKIDSMKMELSSAEYLTEEYSIFRE